ncbi:hypothetical protein NQ317_001388 [Molorchus minor]|uniref:Uncharacterized protein n=1 Tax=Molorchus minor TaxID=1323400 RepID=A0ABQ9IQY4_9CUCU|nr:hypothetical protein NQ317_001388 [Molorchus minor]
MDLSRAKKILKLALKKQDVSISNNGEDNSNNLLNEALLHDVVILIIGNLDEVLNPKLTLSDYQITEIYVVLRGTASLNQAFSTSDIMALRKEEERKQMHTKTGGGVFNLIFRRGKSSMGSGSISSDTRSISPTQSDDSRSVTPPADPPSERPKPPQRKRRPAPKPPQESESRKNSVDKPPSNISETANEVNELQSRKTENGLTICHSRNSSDSSGYHEASVLSENCNTSLPRRPKSAFVTGGDIERMSKAAQSEYNKFIFYVVSF